MIKKSINERRTHLNGVNLFVLELSYRGMGSLVVLPRIGAFQRAHPYPCCVTITTLFLLTKQNCLSNFMFVRLDVLGTFVWCEVALLENEAV